MKEETQNKGIDIRFDFSGMKEKGFDNQWKTFVEVLYNSGLPFLLGVVTVTSNTAWPFIIWLFVAMFYLKIERKVEK